MINIQIGSNDMCGACNSSYMNEVTPDKFGCYVEAAVDKIQANIPRVLVNLIATFNVSQIFPLTTDQSYCRYMHSNTSTKTNTQECSCATTPGGLEKMNDLSAGMKRINLKCKY